MVWWANARNEVRASRGRPSDGLAQHGADTNEDQITDCNHDRQLDNQYGDAEEDLNYAQREACGG